MNHVYKNQRFQLFLMLLIDKRDYGYLFSPQHMHFISAGIVFRRYSF